MKVKAYKQSEARDDQVTEWYSREYLHHDDLVLKEALTYQSMSDFADARRQRISQDNGKTWSEWESSYDAKSEKSQQGEHIMDPSFGYGGTIWNPVHKHYVTIRNQYIWIDGVKHTQDMIWKHGDSRYLSSHAYISVSADGKEQYSEMIRYQDGDEFDPEDWAKRSYTFRNYLLAMEPKILDESGDIFFATQIPLTECCEILGRDVMDIYPTKPHFPHGIMIFRGVWDGTKYQFSYGTPIVISDILSSRGFDEPDIAKLSSGRIVVIIRASNAKLAWKTRVEPGTPGVKWFAWSDDNGKTFTDCMPWHFDDGEYVYSSATYSKIFKDPRTGKHYWIGNITGHKVKGNFPRYPLNIVELDETYGTAKKESLTVIDTRREGEPESVQLSNFNLLYNRETGNLEIRLSKLGQFDINNELYTSIIFKSEAWIYEITLD